MKPKHFILKRTSASLSRSTMKQFNRLPRWLRIIGPVALVSGCMAINAVAFAEILQTFHLGQWLRPIADRVSVTVPSTTPPAVAPAEITAALEPGSSSPKIGPEATLEEANALSKAKPIGATPQVTDPSSNAEPSNIAPSDAAPKPNSPKLATPKLEPKYGHFPYLAASPADMQLVASYAHGEDQRYETLHPDAAAALFKMVSAARAEGVWLVPASGFRTLAQQRTLFTAQIASKGSPEAAALVSAPPGHSEHHTGYAVDLADGSLAQAYDISDTFAKSGAYAWLLANAAQFGFELSFPQGNAQGISYEPWHWRYVGSAEAKAIFHPVDTSNDAVE